MFDNTVTAILIGAVAVPLVLYGILALGEKAIGDSPRVRARPWVWLSMPLLVVGLVLVYPLILTVYYSFKDARATSWVGLDNYTWAFSSEMAQTLWNNVIWLILLPIGTVALALLVAVLFDRVRYEKLAITLIILPTAISFTASSVIWRGIFSYQGAGETQTGLLNALWTLIPGATPVAWLQTPFVNTLALIFVAIWASLGISVLILSAAVKGIPGELVEAARLDGAGEWRVFTAVTIPHLKAALLVVTTTSLIFSLKVFDIIYVMTNGNFGTDTIANREYYELFSADNLGRASSIATLLLVVAIPIIAINAREFRSQRSAS